MKRYAVAATFTVMIVLTLANTAWAQGATNFAMVGITRGQTLQLNLVAFPPNPCSPFAATCTGVTCEAELGFQDGAGNQLGTVETVTLTTGQSASLTLNGDTIIGEAKRVEVLPKIVSELPPDPCFASVGAIDNILGITTLQILGAAALPTNPTFGMLDVIQFQTVRLNVVDEPPDPCIALLSFADKNGNTVGQTLNVNLSSGQSQFLDVPGSAFFSSEPSDPDFDFFSSAPIFSRALVHPIVTQAPGAVPACTASVEVYDSFTGRGAVYLPPDPCVQSCAVPSTVTIDMTPRYPRHFAWLRQPESIDRLA